MRKSFCTMVEVSAPLGIIHFTKDCIINSCNEKFEEIIGAPKSRLIGMDMLKLAKSKNGRGNKIHFKRRDRKI